MSPFPIDPGTVPPLTGPGVVAAHYTLRNATIGNGWVLTLHGRRGGEVQTWVGRTGRKTWSVKGAHGPLRRVADRLKRRLDGVAKHGSGCVDELTLRTWLRELNLQEKT